MDAMFTIVAWLTVKWNSFHLFYFFNLQYSQVKSRMGIDFILWELTESLIEILWQVARDLKGKYIKKQSNLLYFDKRLEKPFLCA